MQILPDIFVSVRFEDLPQNAAFVCCRSLPFSTEEGAF